MLPGDIFFSPAAKSDDVPCILSVGKTKYFLQHEIQ